MGFFDFLKKEEPKPEVIEFLELPHWLDDFVKRKNLDDRFEDFKEDLESTKEKLLKAMDELEEADLMNPKIPDRAKHVMEGNRNRYISRMKRFVSDLEFPNNHEEVGYFASKLSEDIEELGRDTAKNYQVLTQFFEDEVKKMAGAVKEFQNKAGEFRKELEDESLDKVKDVKRKLKELSEGVQMNKEWNESLEKEKEELDKLKERKEKLESRIEDLKNSQAYEGFKDLHEKKAEVQDKLDDLKKDLESDFFTLERALKKYTHNTPDEKIVLDYLDGAAHALTRDSELKIANIIDELKGKLSELGLKERQKANSLEAAEKLTRDYLRNAKDNLESMREEISRLTQRLKGNMTSMNISEQEAFLKKVKGKIEEQEESVRELKGKLEDFSADNLKKDIKGMVKELANVEFKD